MQNPIRSELLENKKYVFERPLLIVTAAGVAAVQLSGNPTALLLPFLLIVIMLINLWFTVNRLRSMARIAAYIDLVLEGNPASWIGWERSLRKHRIWTKQHSLDERRTALSKYATDEAIPDAMMFYGPLLLLHVMTVIAALAISCLTLVAKTQLAETVSFAATLGVAIVFARFWLGPYRSSQMRDLIEIQRATWVNVLEISAEMQDAEHAAARGRADARP